MKSKANVSRIVNLMCDIYNNVSSRVIQHGIIEECVHMMVPFPFYSLNRIKHKMLCFSSLALSLINLVNNIRWRDVVYTYLWQLCNTDWVACEMWIIFFRFFFFHHLIGDNFAFQNKRIKRFTWNKKIMAKSEIL